MTRKYFGTDGIRGRVGETPITPDFCLKLGWAAGRVFARNGRRRILIGKDTRVSGYMLESVLEAGLASAGVDVRLLGPDADPCGRISDANAARRRRHRHQRLAQSVLRQRHQVLRLRRQQAAKTRRNSRSKRNSIRRCNASRRRRSARPSASMMRGVATSSSAKRRSIVACDCRGFKIVLDCAHGATYDVAPGVFAELGADISRDRRRTRRNEHQRELWLDASRAAASRSARHRADLGIAFDGDGDRVLMVDQHGAVLDGDELLFIVARHRQRNGKLVGGVDRHADEQLWLGACVGRQLSDSVCALESRRSLHPRRAEAAQLGAGRRRFGAHRMSRSEHHRRRHRLGAAGAWPRWSRAAKSLAELRNGMEKLPQTLVNVERDRTGSRRGDSRA